MEKKSTPGGNKKASTKRTPGGNAKKVRRPKNDSRRRAGKSTSTPKNTKEVRFKHKMEKQWDSGTKKWSWLYRGYKIRRKGRKWYAYDVVAGKAVTNVMRTRADVADVIDGMIAKKEAEVSQASEIPQKSQVFQEDIDRLEKVSQKQPESAPQGPGQGHFGRLTQEEIDGLRMLLRKHHEGNPSQGDAGPTGGADGDHEAGVGVGAPDAFPEDAQDQGDLKAVILKLPQDVYEALHSRPELRGKKVSDVALTALRAYLGMAPGEPFRGPGRIRKSTMTSEKTKWVAPDDPESLDQRHFVKASMFEDIVEGIKLEITGGVGHLHTGVMDRHAGEYTESIDEVSLQQVIYDIQLELIQSKLFAMRESIRNAPPHERAGVERQINETLARLNKARYLRMAGFTDTSDIQRE